MENKNMTAVEWLHENNKVIAQMLLDNKISQSIIDQLFNCFVINLEQAKQMEKEQKEISDEEILKAAKEYVYEDLDISVGSFELGARWYREQVKTK